ncbi:lipocalin family protein [Pedobacter sp.]|uniref:lipocalin family protein n=1 Tax=Pedobacter sp. TaxID=1411316 RepID=UPI003D7FB107
MAELDPKHLYQKWTHAFEEDTENEMVYRPAGYTLKRARGRTQLDIKENGALVDFQIGNNDIPAPVNGTWKVEDDQLMLRLDDGTEQNYPIKEVTPEVLILKKGK